jgi:uncharacterized membrane protein HdeD (DUF308 family)
MTVHDTRPGYAQFAPPSPWACSLLGIVLILAGLLVLGNVAFVTIASTIFIGFIAIFAGGFEIIHAFWTKGWGGFAWQIFLGLVYVAFGITLLNQPVVSVLVLTYIFGLLLLASGIVRIALGIAHLKESEWTMLLSGILGTLAGLVILTGWPISGLAVLGFLLGADLLFLGIAWLAYAWHPMARTT